jgi:hypothetical protein
MKKNLYYQTLFRRRNILKESILSLFFALSSYPRLLLEVFIRKNFGERYFSFMTACTIIALLAFYPLFTEGAINFRGFNEYFNMGNFLLHYFTWYLFLAGFLYMSIKRNEEVKHLPSVFDFARFSLSTGELHPQILGFKWQGKSVDIRTMETLVEPALFFFIGILLKLGGQSLGTLLIICSIMYSLSYVATYMMGDHFVMDKIDEMICSEELVSSFVEGNDTSQTRGVPFYGHRPADPETRRKLADVFMGDVEEIVEAR